MSLRSAGLLSAMQRKVVVAVVSLTVLLGAAGAALLLQPPSSVRLSDAPGAANHVALYQNGLASVRLVRTFDAGADGGETRLSFPLPPTTVFDSITIEGAGVRVKEIRSALSQTGGIHPGDVVAAHIGDQTYRGTVQALEGGKLVLSTATGLAYVELGKVDAVEVERALAAAATPGSVEATALVAAESGLRTVTLSYLVQGPGWTPSYRLDADSGDAVFFATLVASDDWRNVTLDLVSGAPHMVYTPAPYSARVYDNKAYTEAAGAPAFDASFAPSTPLGDLHKYSLAGTIDLARGESVRLVLAQGKLEPVRRYYDVNAGSGWGGARGDGQDVTVLERLMLRNAMGEPLPPGIVRMYRGGEFVGEDMLPNLPVGDEGNVTLSTARDVKARLVLTEMSSTGSTDRYGYELTVRNLFAGASAKTIDLHASINVPTYRTTLLSSTPGGDVKGGLVSWDQMLESGASAVFRLSYETSRY